MKKIISLIVALTMIFALAITASAADEPVTGFVIKPNVPEGADASNLNYMALKLLDATVTDDGKGKTYYVLATNTDMLENLENPATVAALGKTAVLFDTTPAADGSKYFVTLTEDGKKATAEEVAWALHRNGVGDPVSIPFNPDTGNYEIYNLDPGYYLVSNTVSGDLLVDTINTVTKIDPRDAKVEYPTITKKVNGAKVITADEGTSVTFTLDVSVPSSPKYGTSYTIHDKTVGVEIDETSVSVVKTSVTPNVENYSGMTVTKNPECADGCAMHIDFSYAHDDATYRITYTGKISAFGPPSLNDPSAENSVYLTVDYADQDNIPSYETPTDTVSISNGTISIYKMKSDNTSGATGNPPLAGAGFVVAKQVPKAEGSTETVTLYYKWCADGTDCEGHTQPHVDWVEDIDDASEYISGSDGKVNFNGLAEGSYTVIEKTVPPGYNKAEDTTVEITVDSNGVAVNGHADIMNYAGSTLPSTGGMGTTLFYILGSLMAVGALVILVTNKRVRV